MSIIRIIKQKNFSIISNVALRDSSLSLKAKGLWAYLLSMPDDWQIHVNHLVKTCTDGKHAIYAALKELKCAGYIEIEIIRVDGRIKKHDYIIHEEPIKTEGNDTKFLLAENQDVENQDVENQTLLITDKIPLLKTDKNNDYPDPPLEPDKKLPSSSSSSEDKELKKAGANTDDLKDVIKAIPVDKKSKACDKLIQKALNTYSTDDIKVAIQYTCKHSKGNRDQFKAYLGKCLQGKWFEGYEPEADGVDKDNTFYESRREMPSSLLEIDAKNGCKISAQVLMERKQYQNEKRHLL